MASESSGPDEDTLVVPDVPDLPDDSSEELSAGSSRYQLLEPLGRGGGGVVYAAHDRELNRRVAVKLLRAQVTDDGSAEDTGSQARLVREARAMARLAHPNVIPVYDVAPYEPGELSFAWPQLAEDDEVPAERGVFVVMEIVEGSTLSDWLRQGDHGWSEVLAVLIPAGRGLEAAHAQGLVHRDFKPGNVLIGDDGRPRVLDFGLARASEQPWLESTPGSSPGATSTPAVGPLTQTGTVMGTPAYMALEQHRGEPATEASDQFSYCVVLYEALYGRRPFRGSSLRQLRKQKEAGKLPAPPTEARVPKWLWVALQRGLSPEPGNRFPSMSALLSVLDSVPRARRRRVVFASASAVALAGIGIGLFGWLGRDSGMCADRVLELDPIWNDTVRAQVQAAFAGADKPYADAAWQSVETHVDDYVGRWSTLREQVCQQTHVEHVQPVEVMHWRDSCLDGARTGLDELLDQFRGADAQTVEHAVAAVAKLPSIDRCASIELAASELARGEQERARRAELEGRLSQARALATMAKYDAASERATEVLASAEGERFGAIVAEARIELGLVAVGTSKPKRAEEELRAALTLAEEIGDEEAATRAGVHLVHVVGTLLQRHDEADRMAEQVAARIRRRGREDELAAEFQRTLGSLREKQGRFDESLQAFERALELRSKLFAEHDPAIAQAWNAIGLAQYRRGDYAAADAAFHRAADSYRTSFGESHPLVGKTMNRIAVVAVTSGKRRAAVAAQREAVAILEKALTPPHMDVANAMNNLAGMLHEIGEDEEALAVNARALELEAQINGKKHPEYGLKLGNRGLFLRALGRHDEAIAVLREQLALYEGIYDEGHASLAFPHVNLASVLGTAGRPDEALVHAESALEIWESSVGPKHDFVITALSVLGEIELELGRRDRARRLAERGLELYDALEGFEDMSLLGSVAFTWARALPASKRDQAVELALRAREAYAAAEKPDTQAKIEKWLTERSVALPPIKSTAKPSPASG